MRVSVAGEQKLQIEASRQVKKDWLVKTSSRHRFEIREDWER